MMMVGVCKVGGMMMVGVCKVAPISIQKVGVSIWISLSFSIGTSFTPSPFDCSLGSNLRTSGISIRSTRPLLNSFFRSLSNRFNSSSSNSSRSSHSSKIRGGEGTGNSSSVNIPAARVCQGREEVVGGGGEGVGEPQGGGVVTEGVVASGVEETSHHTLRQAGSKHQQGQIIGHLNTVRL